MSLRKSFSFSSSAMIAARVGSGPERFSASTNSIMPIIPL
ncbi:Uncharacterised protein [Mycobacterium tuberculosis]|nr:Uncharacterised protein [Mycobacterium tuberculosis]